MNFENYTDRARGFVQAAQSLALREGHQKFTPEHLLKVLRVPETGVVASVDHDSPATVADVPLGHQILVPCSELLGI